MSDAGAPVLLKLFYEKGNLPARDKVGLALTPLFIAVILLLLEFYGWQQPFVGRISPALGLEFEDERELWFFAQVHATTSVWILFILLPVGLHLLAPIGGSNPFGLSLGQVRANIRPYLILIAVMLPILWIATSRPGFYNFYPIYRPTGLNDWLVYESVYLLQFVGVEFFFRGWGLFRMEKMFPGYGVFLMTLPYALIHIHKPFPEAIASIVAGIVLGLLALKTRSIWPGLAVHVAVAFSADLFSLVHSGLLISWF